VRYELNREQQHEAAALDFHRRRGGRGGDGLELFFPFSSVSHDSRQFRPLIWFSPIEMRRDIYGHNPRAFGAF
jgi:hypothetical protein